MKKKNIAVFFGGRSFEHDVSIITGLQIINNLNKFKYNIIPVYITKQGKWLSGEKLKSIAAFKNFSNKNLFEVYMLSGDNTLYKKGKFLETQIAKIDVAVAGTHGGEGEDGTLSAILKASNVLWTSTGVLESAVTMSKSLLKEKLVATKKNVLPFIKVKNDVTNYEIPFNFPVIIKPDKLGSSIGIKLCENEEELSAGLIEAFSFDDEVIIEKALTDFFELNIALFRNGEKLIVSEIEKPKRVEKILSFENKYIGKKQTVGMENLQREFPAVLDDALEDEVFYEAARIYDEFNLNGVCRADFMFDNEEKKLYLNEINTIPGSLAFYLFKNKFNFSRLLDQLIENELNKKNKIKNFTFKNDLIENFCETYAGEKTGNI